MAKHIRARIDELFQGDEPPNTDWLRTLLSSLESSWRDAEKAESHSFVALFTAWAIAAAIGAGLISGGQVASFSFTNLRQLLIVAPPVVAFFAYRYMLFGSVSMLLWNSVSQIYKHVLPKAYDVDLDELIGVGTVFGAQRALRPEPAERTHLWVHTWWMRAIPVGGIVGPLLAIAHITYLLWGIREWSHFWVILSALVAAVIYARGIFIVVFVGGSHLNPQTNATRSGAA